MTHAEIRKSEILAARDTSALFAKHEQIGGPEGVIRITWFLESPEAQPSIKSLKFLQRFLDLRIKTVLK